MSRRGQSIGGDVLAGARGGVVGGLAVSALLAGKLAVTGARAGELVLIQRRAEARLGLADRHEGAASDAREETASHGWHLLLSAGLGATYGLLRRRLPGSPAWAGALFGLGFLPLAYGVAGPKLGLVEPVWEEAPALQAQRVLVHALFGVLTGVVAEAVVQDGG